MTNEDPNIRLRDAMDAARQLAALIRIGAGDIADPEPGSETAALLAILALSAMPEHRPSPPSRH